MAEGKRLFLFEKQDESQGIPPPIASPASKRACKARRFRVLARHFALFGLAFFFVHRWVNQVKPGLEAETAQWLANPFVFHRKEHEVLNGKAAEELFLTVPEPASALAASRQYATKPHLAGTPQDLETAKDFLALLQHELGIAEPVSQPIFSAGTPESRDATLSIPRLDEPKAWIDVYYPVMNNPLDHSVSILGDDGKPVWAAPLEEVADGTDPEAGRYYNSVTAFHGLSRNGEAKGKLVYASYGRQQDYQALVEKGIDLNGAIVLVKYGDIFRGLKVKGAQELGAAGVLIYSDPADDGTVKEEDGYLPYPHGPARNPNSIQRGSVQYISIYPGDPTTPGYPSYENATRTDGENIPGIPSLPLSWANAKVLLDEISEGGLNRTVSLVNHVETKVTPIWNTMGVIPGHIKDEVVVIGNHRDAWVMGATDPSSGTASVNEIIRGLGVLLKKGWKPLRTILIASWDAEEYGLIGSTEWGEDFAEFIEDHVVAYVNIDSSVSGSRFRVSASPSLAHLVHGAALDVPHPTKANLTLWDATKDSGVLHGKVDGEVASMYEEQFAQADKLGVNPLGSGSDYTVFLQRIGVSSTNGGFSSTLQDPVYHYHSVFDSQRWQELYGDPGFTRHVAIAKYLGLQVLRLADSVILPLNTTHYALELEAYLDKVEGLASASSLDVNFSSLRDSIRTLQSTSEDLDKEKHEAEKELKKVLKRIVHRRFIRRKLRHIFCSVKKVFGKECRAPWREGERRHEFQDARIPRITTRTGQVIKPRIGRFPVWVKEQRARKGCELKQRPFHHPKLKKAIERVHTVNEKLVAFERGFISKEGIKDREWYRHLGVAPGKWLGYGATTLPALTESITIEHNSTLAKYEAKRLKQLINSLAEEIKP